jgi:hypothetical protein
VPVAPAAGAGVVVVVVLDGAVDVSAGVVEVVLDVLGVVPVVSVVPVVPVGSIRCSQAAKPKVSRPAAAAKTNFFIEYLLC